MKGLTNERLNELANNISTTLRFGEYQEMAREILALRCENEISEQDTKRMDWLCSHVVEVRKPMPFGSHAMFHAKQDSEEWDLPHHTTLREQVDEALRAGGKAS